MGAENLTNVLQSTWGPILRRTYRALIIRSGPGVICCAGDGGCASEQPGKSDFRERGVVEVESNCELRIR